MLSGIDYFSIITINCSALAKFTKSLTSQSIQDLPINPSGSKRFRLGCYKGKYKGNKMSQKQIIFGDFSEASLGATVIFSGKVKHSLSALLTPGIHLQVGLDDVEKVML